MRYEVVIESPTNAYILDKDTNRIVTLCSTKRPDLGFERLLELVRAANMGAEKETGKHHIVLPATDNETVYCIMPNVDTDVHEVFIVTVEKSYTHRDGIKFLGIMDDVDDWECDLSDFGKTVFHTREEAEKVLSASDYIE